MEEQNCVQEKFMLMALRQAKIAYKKGEIPIGVVIVQNDKIIARAYNKRNSSKNALDHAEMIAIKKACKIIGDWRLDDCDMFVTLMPCPMCAGAIINARIRNVYYGAENDNKELFEKILKENALNHKTNTFGGVLKTKCTTILQEFFNSKR